MHSSSFFNVFPPPKFLLMPHVGIDISDDAISFIEYSRPIGDRRLVKFGCIPLSSDIIEGGDVKDEQKLINILTDMVHTHNISYAKVSIPEEKAYLFETEIPYGDLKAISQNIEFKLEENIPLAAPDAVFAFDILPGEHNKPWRASVSAIPRTYIEHMVELFRKSGITPIAFETIPRAIARIISSPEKLEDILVIHTMSHKTGIYVISQHAVGFTSTIAAGYNESETSSYVDTLASEVRRVYSYWLGKNGDTGSNIKKVVVIGQHTETIAPLLRNKVVDIIPVHGVDVWREVINTSRYVPPIPKADSYGYAPSVGLAL